jgi:hypothetical protein
MPPMNRIFNRAVPPDESPPESAVRAIVHHVRKPERLLAAEAAWRKAQARHQSLFDQLRLAIAGQPSVDHGGREGARINSLNGEVTEASEQVRLTLTELLEQREPYLRGVILALAPMQRDIAIEALSAADALRTRLAELEAIDVELGHIGAPPQSPFAWRERLMVIVAPLRRLARLAT